MHAPRDSIRGEYGTRGQGRGPELASELLDAEARWHNSQQELNLPFVCSDNFSGGYIGGVTPVPIPNTEVKPSRADGTPRETARESRSPPGFLIDGRQSLSGAGGRRRLRAVPWDPMGTSPLHQLEAGPDPAGGMTTGAMK